MTTTTQLTPEETEALRIMREIVAEKGHDYVYPESEKDGSLCQYLRYDENGTAVGPSCIAGHYLVRTGMDVESLRHSEGRGVIVVVGKIPLDSRLAGALGIAQEAQDRGETWGQALRFFERALGIKS